jgi:hypothetical protein
MSCGGNMMRTSLQPLAHLVDAAAEKWLAAEHASEQERAIVRQEITQAFRIGDRSELTFHGLRYLLSIIRSDEEPPNQPQQFLIEVHQIVSNS